ncbi:MAG: AAA family ATPase [Oscillospiraceae bacterium]|jgi:chromosome partitioning protein|nr:AAA family ATPase [Oscillospiraceae bacterium]
MGKIIAVVNQKGGVGKTTTAVNLSCALCEAGTRTLLTDFDPQGNATSGMGVDKNVAPTVYEALVGTVTAERAVVLTRYGGALLPANKSLSGAEIELVSVPNREYLLKQALETLRHAYDFILIDCPPSLGLLTLNALCAADTVLVPVQCEYYALEGLSDLMYTIRLVRTRLNPTLDLEGVLLTMFDGRTNLSPQVAAEVKRFFPGKLYATVIPRNVRLSEAPSHGMPVQHYDRASRGADSYSALAREVISKNRGAGR